MTYWLETVTAVGVRLEADDSLTRHRAARHRRSSEPALPADGFGRTQRAEYDERIASKRWRELWPKVQFLD